MPNSINNSALPIINKFIIIAPHLNYPPRNGADIYVEKIGRYLSVTRENVIIIGAETITYYQKCERINQVFYKNQFRPKSWAALRTILFKSHYLVEKFLTNEYHDKAIEIVNEHLDAAIIYSFIFSSNLELTTRPAIILTHNDELEVYRNHRVNSKNPIQKIVAAYSQKWLLKYFYNSNNVNIYAHISEIDRRAYCQYIPRNRSFVVPAGTDYHSPILTTNTKEKKIHLLFCGSLNIKMNLDALLNFKENFWGLLKNHFQADIDVWIAGSNPTNAVIKVCKNQGWVLYPDLNDEELNSLYEKATFAILPYEYSAGVKMKLLNGYAAGLPALATLCVKTMPEQDFLPNLFSNDPKKWLKHLQDYQNSTDGISSRIACQRFAMQYNWANIIDKLDDELKIIGI